MTIQAVIPYWSAPWGIQDLLETCGNSSVPLLIVDNSPESDITRLHIDLPPNVELITCPENMGASAAWNLALAKGADQTFIVSQWVRFAPAEFPRRPAEWGLDHIARGIEHHSTEYGMTFGDQGYHCISIGRKMVNTIGLFDESLYFQGNDDCYEHRMELMGVRGTMGSWGEHWESGVYSITFAANKRGAAKVDYSREQVAAPHYYTKWCSSPDKYPGDYQRPYDDAHNSIGYWPAPAYQGSGLKWSDGWGSGIQ